MVEMTDHQRAVLAHIVVDPDAWLQNAVNALGYEKAATALQDKVSRWEPDYVKAKNDEGRSYRNRADRVGGDV